MSTHEFFRLQVTVELPPKDPAEALQALYARITEVGGRIVDLEAVKDETLLEPVAPEIRVRETFPVVDRLDFLDYVRTEQQASTNLSSRLWGRMSKAVSATKYGEKKPASSLDIGSIRERLRGMERGERTFPGLYRCSWNTLATFNNAFIHDQSETILPWDDDIHPYLYYYRPTMTTRRIGAVKMLAILYERYFAEALAKN